MNSKEINAEQDLHEKQRAEAVLTMPSVSKISLIRSGNALAQIFDLRARIF
jgi:hypothetical protein